MVFDCRIGIRQEDNTQKFESNLLVMCTRFQDFLMQQKRKKKAIND